jgi:hypothetical protein
VVLGRMAFLNNTLYFLVRFSIMLNGTSSSFFQYLPLSKTERSFVAFSFCYCFFFGISNDI